MSTQADGGCTGQIQGGEALRSTQNGLVSDIGDDGIVGAGGHSGGIPVIGGIPIGTAAARPQRPCCSDGCVA